MQEITLAPYAIAVKPVTILVPNEDALAYTEALNMLDERRQSEGSTPLKIQSVREVPDEHCQPAASD